MEINRAVRSCIKLIVEKDGLSSNHMVLCVFSLKIGGILILIDKVEMELTDGWYVIKTEVDHTLENHCVAGKIFVGQKLHIQGALVYIFNSVGR
jgi:breast cancer 2 susceptibility protein